MAGVLYLAIMFVAKVFDNMLGTAKTILVQRNRCVLAGVSLALSNFLYLCITKNIVTTDSNLALVIVSIASGVGCCLAVAVSNRFSKEKTYVNVIAVKEGNENSDKIKALVDVLKSDEIKDFINEKYDGAVIPFEDSDDAEAEDTEAADADESADAEADTADEAAEETDAE